MPSERVRSDYDELKVVYDTFSQQSSAIASVNRKIKAAQGTLQGGDWIGKGADAFFKEMDGEVNPAMKRLEKALEKAAQVTIQASKTFKQAEDEASGKFRIQTA